MPIRKKHHKSRWMSPQGQGRATIAIAVCGCDRYDRRTQLRRIITLLLYSIIVGRQKSGQPWPRDVTARRAPGAAAAHTRITILRVFGGCAKSDAEPVVVVVDYATSRSEWP